MPKDAAGIEQVRQVVSRALGDGRLAGVGEDVALVRNGIITSIESVLVVLELEREYGRSDLEQLVTPADWTLRRIAAVLTGESVARGEPDSGPAAASRLATLRRAADRPGYAVVAILLCFVIFNTAVGHAFSSFLAGRYRDYLERGKRFYPYSGAFSHDDFAFAVQHHEVSRVAAPHEKRVWMFGDSGTIGSFVRADETIAASAERVLRHSDPSVRVLNLAWYGRVLPKDFMLLEAVWKTPALAAVFTLADDYFSRSSVDRWLAEYRHVSVNVPLFDALTNRVSEDRRACFSDASAALHAADRQDWGAVRRWSFENIPIVRYRPFLQYEWHLHVLPSFVGSSMRAQTTTFRDFRYARDVAPRRLVAGVAPEDFDARQECMLETVLTMLERRGVRTALYVEPLGPASWIAAEPHRITAFDVATRIAARTGSQVIDLTSALTEEDFLDSAAHYTPAANRRIGERVASALLAGRTTN